MECVFIFAGLVIAVAVLSVRMLFGKGPNNWRRLIRLDLAALLVILTGVAGALAVVRGADLGSALCVLTIVLPMSLAFAWLARYVIEDVAAWRIRRGKNREADLSFLASEHRPDEEIVPAELADERRPDLDSEAR
jgi:hypothetical protein